MLHVIQEIHISSLGISANNSPQNWQGASMSSAIVLFDWKMVLSGCVYDFDENCLFAVSSFFFVPLRHFLLLAFSSSICLYGDAVRIVDFSPRLLFISIQNWKRRNGRDTVCSRRRLRIIVSMLWLRNLHFIFCDIRFFRRTDYWFIIVCVTPTWKCGILL